MKFILKYVQVNESNMNEEERIVKEIRTSLLNAIRERKRINQALLKLPKNELEQKDELIVKIETLNNTIKSAELELAKRNITSSLVQFESAPLNEEKPNRPVNEKNQQSDWQRAEPNWRVLKHVPPSKSVVPSEGRRGVTPIIHSFKPRAVDNQRSNIESSNYRNNLNLNNVKAAPDYQTVYLTLSSDNKYTPTEKDKYDYVMSALNAKLVHKHDRLADNSSELHFYSSQEEACHEGVLRIEADANTPYKKKLNQEDMIIVKLKISKAMLNEQNKTVKVEYTKEALAKAPELLTIEKVDSLAILQDVQIKRNYIAKFADEYQNLLKREIELQSNPTGLEIIKQKIKNAEKYIVQLAKDNHADVSQFALNQMQKASIKGLPEKSFVQQLISGSKNILSLKEGENKAYLESDIKQYATSLLSIAKPHEIVSEILVKFESATTKEEKEKILINASSLLHHLILTDSAQQYFQDFTTLDSLRDAVAKDLGAARGEQFQTVLASSFDENNRQSVLRGDQITKLTTPASSPVNFEDIIQNQLATNAVNEGELNSLAKAIAQDLKNVAAAQLLQIKTSEWYGQAWNKKGKESTQLFQSMQYADNLTHMVVNDLLSAKSLAHQSQIAVLYAKILDESVKNNDFSTAMALQNAFEHPAVSKIKNISAHPEVESIVINATQKLGPTQSDFKSLRSSIADAEKSESAAVPFLGMYTKDQTFIDDGNQDKVNNDINSKKLEVMSDSLKKIISHQEKLLNMTVKELQSNVFNRVNTYVKDEKMEYTKANRFAIRPIDINSDDGFKNLIVKLINQEKLTPIQAILPLTIELTGDKGKVYTQAAAYSKMIEIIDKKMKNKPTVEDQISASVLLKAIKSVASQNGLLSPKLAKAIQKSDDKINTKLIDDKVNQIFKSGAQKDFTELAMIMSKLGSASNQDIAKSLLKIKQSGKYKGVYTQNYDKLLTEYSKVMITSFIINPVENMLEMKRLLSNSDPVIKGIIVESMRQQMLSRDYPQDKIAAAMNLAKGNKEVLDLIGTKKWQPAKAASLSNQWQGTQPSSVTRKNMIFGGIKEARIENNQQIKSPVDLQKDQLSDLFNTIVKNTNEKYGQADKHFGRIMFLLAGNPKYEAKSMQYATALTGDFLAKAYPYPEVAGNRDQLVIDTIGKYMESAQKYPTALSSTYELVASINYLRVTLDRMTQAQAQYKDNPQDLKLAMEGHQEIYSKQLNTLISLAKNSKEKYIQAMVPGLEKLADNAQSVQKQKGLKR